VSSEETHQRRHPQIVPDDPWTPVTYTQWTALRERYPHPERILVAMRLAQDIATCEALLHGRPVDPDRLDQEQLRWAKTRQLVRLDLRAIDQLTAA